MYFDHIFYPLRTSNRRGALLFKLLFDLQTPNFMGVFVFVFQYTKWKTLGSFGKGKGRTLVHAGFLFLNLKHILVLKNSWGGTVFQNGKIPEQIKNHKEQFFF